MNAVLAGLRLHQNHPGIQAFGLGALGNLATAEDNCAVILKASDANDRELGRAGLFFFVLCGGGG